MNQYVQKKTERLQNKETIISKESRNSMEPILHTQPAILTLVNDWASGIEKGGVLSLLKFK